MFVTSVWALVHRLENAPLVLEVLFHLLVAIVQLIKPTLMEHAVSQKSLDVYNE